MPIQDLIAEMRNDLTRTERKIARAIVDDPTIVAFNTVSELATRASTSRPSVVRFAVKLGFNGYTDLQNWVRADLARQLMRPTERIRAPRGSLDAIRVALQDANDDVFRSLDKAQLKALATPLATAPRVWILSGETSMAGAYTLYSGLSMTRCDVFLVQEHDAGRDLASAGRGDAAAIFDFARYRRSAVRAAHALRELGVTIVAITDGPLSPLAPLASTWCEIKVPAVGPFDSSVPTVVAAELLVATVVELLGEDARERIDRLESLWKAMGTYHNDGQHEPEA